MNNVVSIGEAANPFWSIDSSSDWSESDIKPRPWIVPRYIMRGKVTGLIGAPEAGKSTLALKWAIGCALLKPFGDFNPIPRIGERRSLRVGILNCEDDEDEQRARIASLIRDTGRPIRDLGQNLIRLSPKADAATLFTAAPDNGEICQTQAFADLRRYIVAQGIDILVIDPLIETLSGLDENSNAVLGSVFAQLRALAAECNMAIVVVHHTRKGGGGAGNLEAARGASAIGGSIRVGYTLAVMSEDEATELGLPKETRKNYVRLDNAKMSYGPPSEQATWFQRFSIELANGDTSPALEPWNAPAAKATSPDALAPIEDAVKAGTPEGLPYSARLSADHRSIKAVLVRNGFTGRQAQERALEAIRSAGAYEDTYVRRDAAGHKKGTGQGLRIGELPKVEWLGGSSSDFPPPTSGDDNGAY